MKNGAHETLEEHDSAVARHVGGRYPWHLEDEGWALDCTDGRARWHEPWWQVLVVWSAAGAAVIGRAMTPTMPAVEIGRVFTATGATDDAMVLAEECYDARMQRLARVEYQQANGGASPRQEREVRP